MSGGNCARRPPLACGTSCSRALHHHHHHRALTLASPLSADMFMMVAEGDAPIYEAEFVNTQRVRALARERLTDERPVSA